MTALSPPGQTLPVADDTNYSSLPERNLMNQLCAVLSNGLVVGSIGTYALYVGLKFRDGGSDKCKTDANWLLVFGMCAVGSLVLQALMECTRSRERLALHATATKLRKQGQAATLLPGDQLTIVDKLLGSVDISAGQCSCACGDALAFGGPRSRRLATQNYTYSATRWPSFTSSYCPACAAACAVCCVCWPQLVMPTR